MTTRRVTQWVFIAGSLAVLGCTASAHQVQEPPPAPQFIVLSNGLPGSTQICVPRVLAMPADPFACTTLRELRKQLRGLRLVRHDPHLGIGATEHEE